MKSIHLTVLSASILSALALGAGCGSADSRASIGAEEATDPSIEATDNQVSDVETHAEGMDVEDVHVDIGSGMKEEAGGSPEDTVEQEPLDAEDAVDLSQATPELKSPEVSETPVPPIPPSPEGETVTEEEAAPKSPVFTGNPPATVHQPGQQQQYATQVGATKTVEQPKQEYHSAGFQASVTYQDPSSPSIQMPSVKIDCEQVHLPGCP